MENILPILGTISFPGYMCVKRTLLAAVTQAREFTNTRQTVLKFHEPLQSQLHSSGSQLNKVQTSGQISKTNNACQINEHPPRYRQDPSQLASYRPEQIRLAA